MNRTPTSVRAHAARQLCRDVWPSPRPGPGCTTRSFRGINCPAALGTLGRNRRSTSARKQRHLCLQPGRDHPHDHARSRTRRNSTATPVRPSASMYSVQEATSVAIPRVALTTMRSSLAKACAGYVLPPPKRDGPGSLSLWWRVLSILTTLCSGTEMSPANAPFRSR